MRYETIRLDREGEYVVLTLDRPDHRNALSTQMRAEITHAFRGFDLGARAVVLTGAPPSFCAGQDLGDRANVGAADLERVLRDEYGPMLGAIAECPVPVIAAVNGPAAGAGANLALACDVVIASEAASFLQPATRIGLLPEAGASYWLPRQIGQARAMGAMLFGEAIPAQQAAAWGMIWEAVPEAQFDARWRSRAAHLAAGPAEAFRAIKQALRESPDRDLAGQLELEAQLQGRLGGTRDFKEGVLALLEGRKPTFEGR